MAKLGKNKKGSLQDLLLIMVMIAVFGIFVLIGSKIGTEFNNQIQTHTSVDNNTAEQTQRTISNTMGSIDSSFLFLVIFLAIAMLILAALVRVHPIFIPIFLIAWILFIFLAGILSNVYQEMATNTELVSVANDLTFITTILNTLPIIIGVFGIILMVIMYKLWTAGQ